MAEMQQHGGDAMNRLFFRLALLGGFCLLLDACSAIHYKPIRADSAAPLIEPASICGLRGDPLYEQDRRFVHLAPNESCYTVARANMWQSRTPIEVQSGEVYEITILPGQAWFDLDRRVDPLVGDKGSTFMNLFRGWKRDKDLPWFSLLALTVAKPLNEQEAGMTTQEFAKSPIPADGRVAIKHDGQLAFSPNDASFSQEKGGPLYANNHGQIWVRVKRSM
jgi:hypothetical protein